MSKLPLNSPLCTSLDRQPEQFSKNPAKNLLDESKFLQWTSFMESELRSYAINSKEFIRGLQDSLELVILLVLLTVIISNHNVIFTMTSSLEESKPSCSSSIRHRKQRKHFDYIRSNSLFSLFDIPSSSLSSLWTFCYFRENGCLFL